MPSRLIQSLVAVLFLAVVSVLSGGPAAAGESNRFGTVEVEVETEGSEQPGAGSGGGGGGEGEGAATGSSGGGGGGGPAVNTACDLTPGAANACDQPSGPAAPVVPPAAVVAQMALDQVTFTVPRPHLSPTEAAHQITGLVTWFWLDPSEWVAATARAELPGVWAEVTAAPVRAVWTPGDGSPPVTCTGPGRPHPGTPGATTDCGHTYTDVGTFTLRLAVTYEVTWTSSTGEAGVEDPIVLTTDLQVPVEQRQAVTD